MKKLDNKKLNFLRKILKTGIESEKEILEIDIQSLILRDKFTMKTLKNLIELQGSIKKKSLFEYLLEDSSEETKGE